MLGRAGVGTYGRAGLLGNPVKVEPGEGFQGGDSYKVQVVPVGILIGQSPGVDNDSCPV